MFKFFRKNNTEEFKTSRRNFLRKGIKTGIGAAVVSSPFLSSVAQASIKFEDAKKYTIKEMFSIMYKGQILAPISKSKFNPENKRELYKGVNPIYVGENNPTIIFISDVHLDNISPEKYSDSDKKVYSDEDQRWSVERGQLEYLRINFNIKDVAIEGWGGREVDDKRGFKILNGEEKLVEWLISNKDYNSLALESDEQQIKTQYLMIFEQVRLFIEKKRMFEELLNKLELELLEYLLSFFVKNYDLNIYSQVLVYNENKILEFYDHSNLFEKSLEFYSNIRVLQVYLREICYKIQKITNKKDLDLDLVYEKINYIYKNFIYKNSNFSYWIRLEIEEKRENIAVEKMYNYFLSNENKFLIVVYGIGHIPNLVSKVLEKFENKVNIYIAK